MSDILKKILDVKVDEVAAAKKHQDLKSLRRDVESNQQARTDIRGFEDSLRAKISNGKLPSGWSNARATKSRAVSRNPCSISSTGRPDAPDAPP